MQHRHFRWNQRLDRLSDQCAGGVIENFLHLGVGQGDVTAFVDDQDAVRRRFQDDRVLLFLDTALGDVARDIDEAAQRSVGAADRFHGDAREEAAAILARPPGFGSEMAMLKRVTHCPLRLASSSSDSGTPAARSSGVKNTAKLCPIISASVYPWIRSAPALQVSTLPSASSRYSASVIWLWNTTRKRSSLARSASVMARISASRAATAAFSTLALTVSCSSCASTADLTR